MKYPVNVTPHMTCVDAEVQQCFTFDFYGEVLSGVECYLYDAITSEYIIRYFGYGRNTISNKIEENSGNVLNMQRAGYKFGQINTDAYVLQNNRKYKYKLKIAQEKINQFVFQGGITATFSTNDRFLVVKNPLLHKPRSYQNLVMTFGFYLAVDIGNERRNVIDYYSYDGTNGCLVFDEPFTQNLSIGTQYRVYSNYITSPEYYFETKKNPEISIVELKESYLDSGGSAWYCNFEQENGQLIKSYNWTIEDYTNNRIYATGLVQRPTNTPQYNIKKISEETTLTTGKNKLYNINDFNSIVESNLSESTDNNVYLRIFWSNIFDSSALSDAKDNIIYIYGSSEHQLDDNPIKLTYGDFYSYFDSGTNELICYVTGFTTGGETPQTITVRYQNTFAELLGECTLDSSVIQSGGIYDFYIEDNNRETQATLNNMNIVKIENIPQETIDKKLVILLQRKRYTSFIDTRIYFIGDEQEMTVNWTIEESVPVEDDESYSDGFVYNAQSIYIDKNLGDIIGKNLIVHDTNFDGSPKRILNYDNSSGLTILYNGYNTYPSESATYTIYNDDNIILSQTNNIYKINTFYRNDYLAIDKRLRGKISIRTEDDSLFYCDKIIEFPKCVKNDNNEPLDILTYLDSFANEILDENATENDTKILAFYNPNSASLSLTWKFKSGYVTNTQDVCVYREEENKSSVNLIYHKKINENSNQVVNYTDYCVANNISYRYIILLQTLVTQDTAGDVEYRYYKYTTDWYNNTSNSWSITGLVKSNEYECTKEIYYIKDTWNLYAQVDSGDIVQNINSKVYSSYSTYPKVGKLNNNYISGTLTAMLGDIECGTDDFIDDIQRVNAWRKFITDYNTYVLRSEKGDIWHISISDNPTTNYDEENELYTTISFSYTQVSDINDIYVRRKMTS